MVGWLARFSATSPHQLSVLSLGGLGLIWLHLQEIPLHITHDGFCGWQTKTKSVIGINWDCVPVPRPTQHSNFFFNLHSLGDLGQRWSRSLPDRFFSPQSVPKMVETRGSRGEQRKRGGHQPGFEAVPGVCIRRQFGWCSAQEENKLLMWKSSRGPSGRRSCFSFSPRPWGPKSSDDFSFLSNYFFHSRSEHLV